MSATKLNNIYQISNMNTVQNDLDGDIGDVVMRDYTVMSAEKLAQSQQWATSASKSLLPDPPINQDSNNNSQQNNQNNQPRQVDENGMTGKQRRNKKHKERLKEKKRLERGEENNDQLNT